MSMLTEKQKAFCDYLLTDAEQNATKAYQRAYPKVKSEAAARTNASRLLTKANVTAYLDEYRAKRAERTQIDADWLLKRLATKAEADLADIYDSVTGRLKPVHEWPMIWRQGMVSGVKTRMEIGPGEDPDVAEIVEVKLSERNAVDKMIGDHIGVQAFKQFIDHKHTHEYEELTEDELNAKIAELQRKAPAR